MQKQNVKILNRFNTIEVDKFIKNYWLNIQNVQFGIGSNIAEIKLNEILRSNIKTSENIQKWSKNILKMI